MSRLLLCVSIALSAVACGTEEIPPGVSTDAGELPDAGAPPDSGEDAGSGSDAGDLPDAGDPCTRAAVRSIVSLAAEPAELSVARGSQGRIAITATFNDGCRQIVTGSLHFTVTPSTIARVVDAPADPDTQIPGRAVEGLAKGTANLVASTGPGGAGVVSSPIAVTVTDDTVVPVNTETRAVWITRFAFSADKVAGPAKIKQLINKAADNNFNAVFLQVRGQGDAYYRSSLVPWWVRKPSTDAVCPGCLGVDPGWDPLQVAIDEAKLRGIEVHAYINALSGWTKSGTTAGIPDSIAGAPKHILKQHPEWTCLDASGKDSAAEYTWIAADPGYVAHFKAVVEELLTRYEMAGVHLDRIRTPGPGFCHSPELDQLFAQQHGTDATKWAAFSRARIDAVVKATWDATLAKRPSAKTSAAVWGIYKRLPGCSTSEGFSGYHQDSLGWVQKGIIDMLNPMIYWDLSPGSCTDWGALVDGFVAGANGRQIVAGMHGLEAGDKPDFSRIAARIGYGRAKKLPGHIVFASAYLDQHSLWDDYKADVYKDAVQTTPLLHR